MEIEWRGKMLVIAKDSDVADDRVGIVWICNQCHDLHTVNRFMCYLWDHKVYANL